jgi:heat shock protein HslJ
MAPASRLLHVSRVLLVLAAALLVAGCADRGAGSADVLGEWFLADGEADGGPLPRPAGSSATLIVGPEELTGRSFCNSFSSTYRLDGATLAVDGVGGTEMGCEPGVMAAETAYLSALGRADTVTLDGADLVLTGTGVRLRFSPLPPVPDRALAGTRWVLDTLVDGDVASSTQGEAVLALAADGTLSGSTGCRTLAGRWTADGGSLSFPELQVGGGCHPDGEAQDAHVTGVLGVPVTYGVTGRQLTLTGAGGLGLVYRSED